MRLSEWGIFTAVVAGSRRLQPAFFSLRSSMTRKLKLAATMCLCAFVPLCLFSSPAQSVPPGPGVKWPEGCACNVNKEAMDERSRAWRAAIASGRMPAPPSPSNPRILVIRVGFSDKPLATTLAQADTFFGKVRNYYIENSYGLFTPVFTVSATAYALTQTMGSYGQGTPSDIFSYADLITDAVSAANSDFNFNNFDQVMVYHAGDGKESSADTNTIWSVFVPYNFSADGKMFSAFTVVPESEAGGIDPLGVICHEYGHQLGLPDLYNTSFSGGLSTVGAWSIMDYPYTGSPRGSNPIHLDAWSKQFLGWLNPQTDSGNLALSPVEVQSAAKKISVPSSSSEYFLVEYRLIGSTATYDKGMPASGVLIWHIDDAIASNSGRLGNNDINNDSSHPGVGLVRADNADAPSLQSGFGNADSGDVFADGSTFTSPQSNNFNGDITGIALANISGVSGNSVSFTLAKVAAAPSLTIGKAINFPNPLGKGYFHPKGENWTTLVLQLSRPVSKPVDLDIYTITGELVKSAPGTDINLKIGLGEPTADLKWVYEYDWDSTNDSGGDVAPGVYLYRFKADDKVTTGKMMIIR